MAKSKTQPPVSRYDGKPHRGGTNPVVMTVGELREALQNYPADLPVNAGMDDGVCLVWFNVGRDDEHLSLEENDETWS